MTYRNDYSADVPECAHCGAGIFASQEVCDDCAAEMEADEPYATSAAPASAPFPIFARQDAIDADGALVLAHLLAVGVTFPARQKVDAAETYTLRHAGSTLAIPSKLACTSLFQEAIERVQVGADAVAFYPARIYRCESAAGAPQISVLANAVPGDDASVTSVGFLQDKHAAWIAPLLDGIVPVGAVAGPECPVKVYLTAVTGGTDGKPTRGVNVAICGTAEAVRRAYDGAAIEAQRERAYGSGNPAAIEAATL